MATVEIFTGPQCAYCEKAKALLARENVPFTEYNTADADHLAEFSRRLPRVRSIPQIFVDGEHIGNDQDLEGLVRAGFFSN